MPGSSPLRANVSQQLKRTQGLLGVVVISLSAMLGSGLFVLPSLATEMMGGGIWLAYILAASVVLPGVLSKSELASAMPTSGGDYIYIERTYGALFGTIAGLGLWASFLLKAAFALIGFAAYMEILALALDAEVNMVLISMFVLVLVVTLNILGVKKIKVIQAPIVGISVLMLLGLSLAAPFSSGFDLSRPVSGSAFDGGLMGLAETAAFVFIAYAGVTKVAAIAEEVKDPGKNLPRGMLISLLAATLLYAGVTFLLIATLPQGWELNADGQVRDDPIYAFAEHIGGSRLGLLAAGIAVLTMTSMALAGILAASRYIFAMARDRLLPQSLENVNARFETPHWPILATGAAMALSMLVLPIHDIAKLASGFQIMIFIVVNSCVVVLRTATSSRTWYEPTYRSPLYPGVQIWGIVGGLLLLYTMGDKAFIGASFAVVIGIVTYYWYGRKNASYRITPFETFRQVMANPSQREFDRRAAAFFAADKGGHGHLNLSEFQRAMNVLGIDFEDEGLRDVFHEVDADASGVIDIHEFMQQFRAAQEEE